MKAGALIILSAAACLWALSALPANEAAPTTATSAAKVTTTMKVKTVQVYKTTKQGKLKMYLSFPPGWKASDRRPGIVFFFGGGWRKGSVQQFREQARYLAGRGMVAARADYRVKSRHGTTPMDAVEDARSAVRWLRANAGKLGLDPKRICGAGGSAGAHLAMCAVLAKGFDAADDDKRISPAVNAWLLFNPPTDLDAARAKQFDFTPEAARKLAPLKNVRKGLPPMLLLYGSRDRMLPEGKAFVAAAKKLGARAEIYIAPGAGHGFFNRSPWRKLTLRRADEFLASIGYLKGPTTIEAK